MVSNIKKQTKARKKQEEIVEYIKNHPDEPFASKKMVDIFGMTRARFWQIAKANGLINNVSLHTKIKVNCHYCGKEIIRTPSQMKNWQNKEKFYNKVFCKECNKIRNTTKVTCLCHNPKCHKLFEITLDQYKNRRTNRAPNSNETYCTKECYVSSITNNKELHPRYGRKHTKESKMKISESHKKKTNKEI